MTAGQPPRRAPRPRITARTRPDPRRRVAVLLGVFVAVGALLFAVLADLAAVRPERYRALGESQLQRTVPIDGYRGSVLDRDGFVLAMSTQAHQLVVDPTLIDQNETHGGAATVAGLLAPVLGRDTAELTVEITKKHDNDRYRLLARGIDDELADRLEAVVEEHPRAMVGVFLRPDEQRVNPAGRLAANLVGATDPDLQGISGIEKKYDEAMTGVDGYATFEGGRFGTISVGERVVQPAEAGADVVLTIDHRLQFVVDQALIEHCEAVEANGASAAIADPRTGELLALSSVIRNEEGACVVPGANLALLHTFEPGSVLKLVTMAGAVEEFDLSQDTPVPVPSHVVAGNKTFRDDHPLAPADYPLWKVLAASSNVGTISLAKELGPQGLYDYLRAFGFGQPTGIGFEGEAHGAIRAPEDWWGSDIGSMPIGQGMTVTLVQLLAAYNTVANDGAYVAPSLVRSVTPAGEEPQLTEVERRQVVSERSAAELRDMLTKVVTDGTGRSAAIPGYEVAGKTGTAWKAVRNADGVMRYTDDDGRRHYVVSFAGFVPADDPQLSMVVTVDEPKTQTMASTVAAPVFASIMQHALRIMGIPPTTTVADGAPLLVRGTPAGSEATEGTEVAGAPAVSRQTSEVIEQAEAVGPRQYEAALAQRGTPPTGAGGGDDRDDGAGRDDGGDEPSGGAERSDDDGSEGGRRSTGGGGDR